MGDYSWGKGRWESIHSTAAWCDRIDNMELFEDWMDMTIKTLPCEMCSIHAGRYLKSNPIDQASSCLMWSYKFHNFVNKHLNKDIFPWDEVYDRWVQGNVFVCDDCKVE